MQFFLHILFISYLFIAAASAQTEPDQNYSEFRKLGGWTINQYQSSESDRNGPSCSAVLSGPDGNAVRLERINDGYFYGVDSLSREQQGNEFKLEFWFDKEDQNRLTGQAVFYKDAAYETSDWLSFFQPIGERGGLLDELSQRNFITFAFLVPGNRTGNDEVTSTFSLFGSAEVITELDRCYEDSRKPKQVAIAPGSCPDDGPRLPQSNICAGRAINYLDFVAGPEPESIPGMLDCPWRTSEASLPSGDILLFQVAVCDGEPKSVRFTASKKYSGVLDAAIADGGWGEIYLHLVSIDRGDPHGSLLRTAKLNMSDANDKRYCRIEFDDPKENAQGTFSLSFEESYMKKLMKSEDGPFDICVWMDTSDTISQWRILGDKALLVDYGFQDGITPIDMRSFTLIKKADLQ